MPGTVNNLLHLLSRHHPVCLATGAFPRCLFCSCHSAELAEDILDMVPKHRTVSLAEPCDVLLTFRYCSEETSVS